MNLLLDPNLWYGGGYNPPIYWNPSEQRYEILVESEGGDSGTLLELNVDAVLGDTIDFDYEIDGFIDANTAPDFVGIQSDLGDFIWTLPVEDLPATGSVSVECESGRRYSIGLYRNGGYGFSLYAFEAIITPIGPDPELTANDDEATTNADTPVTVDVLANDTYGDEPVTLEQLEGPPTIHEQPANGTVSVAPDGKITYTPNPGFTGTDEFVYRIAMEEPPEPFKLCVDFGEGWSVYNQFDGIFDKNLPIRIDSNYGGCATLDYNPEGWAQYWQVDYSGNSECPDSFYPDNGEIVIVSQGDVSIEAKVYGSIGIRVSGGYWEINQPWWGLDPYTELLLTYEGESYSGMVNDSGTTIDWDNPPPSPQGGVPYTAEIMYTMIGEGEIIQCALVTIAMD